MLKCAGILLYSGNVYSTEVKPMNRSSLFALIAVVTAASLTAAFLYMEFNPSNVTLSGSLFVSDAGRSHGGFEYNAEWDAKLTVEGTTGTLGLVLHAGLGDPLEQHEYRVESFSMDSSTVNMIIEGHPLVLVWVEDDVVWDHAYDRHYIASWGSDAPREEIRGVIMPTIFPGLVETYYVELRLRT